MAGRGTGPALLFGAAALGSIWVCESALAQAPATSEMEDEERVIDPVIVTATKRQTTLEETPVAVSVVTGEELQDAGIFDLQSVQQVVPSLTVTTSTSEIGGASIKLRGVGTNANNFGIEPSVGVFVDGVYFNRSGIALNDIFDVENIQVLRGPQSTIFGKNTSAGALLITTRSPVYEVEGELSASVGSFNLRKVSGVFNAPLVDERFAVRIGGQFQERDGVMEDLVTGQDYNDRDRWLVRAQALWEPTPRLSFRIIADASSKDEACCVPTLTVDDSPRSALVRGLGGEVGDPDDAFSTAVSLDPRSETEEWGASVTAEWDAGFADVTFIVSHRDYEGLRVADVDFNSLDIFVVPGQRLESQLTTAETYASGTAGRVDWLVGAFYLDETLDERGATVFGEDTGLFFSQLVPPPFRPLIAASYPEGGGQTRVDFFQDGTAFSLYTHNVVELTDSTSLTLGLRYSDDDKEGGGRFETTNNPSCALPPPLAALRLGCPVPDYDDSFSEDNWTGTVALMHALNAQVSLFGSYSRGFKAGGINFERTGAVNDTATVGSEKSDNYEVGVRSRFEAWDTRLALIGFYTEFTDFQVNVLDPVSGGFRFSNEGEVTSQGVEIDLETRPLEGLRLNGSVTYADVRFAEDVANPTFAGGPPNNAPEWTAQFGGNYSRPVGNWGRGFVAANVRYQSDHFTSASLDPNSEQEAYAIANLRVGLTIPEQGFEIAVWANNLFDEEVEIISFPTPQLAGNWSAFVAEPRIVGLTLTKSF